MKWSASWIWPHALRAHPRDLGQARRERVGGIDWLQVRRREQGEDAL